MNQQVKAGLNAVRDFLAGRSGEAKPEGAPDPATREVVAAELLAAMSGRNAHDSSDAEAPNFSAIDTQEIPRFPQLNQSESSNNQERERARKLFLDHGYFDEAVEKLGSATSPAERVAAARALGLFGSQRATAHLIAAMFDEDADVRDAAEAALAQIGEPTVSQNSLGAAMNVESPLSEPAVEALEFAATKPAAEVMEGVNKIDDAIGAEATDEESQLLLEEQTIRGAVETLGKQLLETVAAIKESENEIQWRIEREGQLRTQAAERRLEEEEVRKRVAEEAETRRAQEREALASEQAARLKAESESERHAEEEINLRLKAVRLRSAAQEVVRRRAEIESARLEGEIVAREASATRVRYEAKARHEEALNRLLSEELALDRATNQVAQQQANVIAAREKAESETQRLKEEQAAVEEAQRTEAERLLQEAETRQAERLLEAQGRMRAAEEARLQTEAERARLEADINQQVETQRGLLEETRRRGEAQQARLQEELRRQAEADIERLTELKAMKVRAEAESKRLAEKEQEVLSQIESLRISDAETRHRTEVAEVRRRAAEDAYRLVAEQVQRVEAEAHARVKEEERIIAKLEAERRTVAIEAEARAEQEKRIREEIEIFRRLEEEERPRIEEANLQLAAAKARLQEQKNRLREDEEARVLVAEEVDEFGAYTEPLPPVQAASRYETTEAVVQPAAESEQHATAFAAAPVVDEVVHRANEMPGEMPNTSDPGSSGVAPAIATYLNSVDPYKRAAAVSELARSGAPDAFNQIVECFDDPSPHVRNAAARAFRKLEPKHTVDLFNRSLEGASDNRRRNIGAAIAASGLASEAIENLASENREDTYTALSILFVMAKTGELHPLVQAIEGHESVQVRMAAIKLLTLTGQAEIANAAAKRRLKTKPTAADYLS